MIDIEQFIAETAKKSVSSTGYFPSDAGSIEPQALERIALHLESDFRVKSVRRQSSGGALKQLWVVLEDDQYQQS